MAKCHNCNKLLNKKSTILECSRCQKVVHATTVCSGLSAKQLAALKAAENLEWTCNDCNLNSSRRRSFVTLADHEEEDDEECPAPGAASDYQQLLQNINKDVKNIVSQELRSVTTSLQYCSDKVDEFAETIDALTSRLKGMEKKIIYLDNQNRSNLLKIEYLEQRGVELEQQLLGDQIEVAGIPESNDLDVNKLVENVVVTLGATKEDVISVKKLPSRKTGPGAVQVRIRQESTRQQLVSAARSTTITAKDLVPNLSGAPANERIYVREALTTYHKNLLWQTKQELKGVFKYIWIRDGKVLVRKEENAKVFKIRSKEDIHNILSNVNNVNS